MSGIPPSIAAETAINRQNVALSVVKASADADQQLAELLDQAVRSAPISSTRGVNLNTSA